MPLLVNKLIFSIIPKRVPFFLRPLANLICGGFTKSFLDPRIKENADFVRPHLISSHLSPHLRANLTFSRSNLVLHIVPSLLALASRRPDSSGGIVPRGVIVVIAESADRPFCASRRRRVRTTYGA